jgi:acyl carrier protein
MNLSEFISDFAKQIEDNTAEITENTEFRNMDYWDSLNGMAVLYMIDKIYAVTIPIEHFIALKTPKEIFDYIQSHKTT